MLEDVTDKVKSLFSPKEPAEEQAQAEVSSTMDFKPAPPAKLNTSKVLERWVDPEHDEHGHFSYTWQDDSAVRGNACTALMHVMHQRAGRQALLASNSDAAEAEARRVEVVEQLQAAIARVGVAEQEGDRRGHFRFTS